MATVSKTYDLITGFVKKGDIQWQMSKHDYKTEENNKENTDANYKWDISTDSSVDDFDDDELFDTAKLKQYIIDLIFLHYFGKQDIKILFLDVDGVLNTIDDCVKNVQLNKQLMGRLKTIIQKTNCKIVLSSDWRLTKKNKKELFTGLRDG